MNPLQRYQINELKQIYLALHKQLPENSELMDSMLLHDLQIWLQSRAASEGINVMQHSQWIAWLNRPQV